MNYLQKGIEYSLEMMKEMNELIEDLNEANEDALGNKIETTIDKLVDCKEKFKSLNGQTKENYVEYGANLTRMRMLSNLLKAVAEKLMVMPLEQYDEKKN